MILIKRLKILVNVLVSNMETNDNTQPCENEEVIDETNDRNKEIPLKKEPTPIEFYDIYP